MIVIYTGIEDVDKEIQKNISNSIIAYYSDYLIENNTFENQTAIISAEAIKSDLHEFLFKLKQQNIRVILLLQKKQKEETKIALQLGIYDILYGNFYPRQIKEIIIRGISIIIVIIHLLIATFIFSNPWILEIISPVVWLW